MQNNINFKKCMSILDELNTHFKSTDFEELDNIELLCHHIHFLFDISDHNRADYSLTSEHFGAKYANFRHAMKLIQYMLNNLDKFNLNNVKMLSYNIQCYRD